MRINGKQVYIWEIYLFIIYLGRTVAQFVKALCHKTGGYRFVSRHVPWKFSGRLFLLAAFSSPVVKSAPNRNEYQRISLGGKMRPAPTADNSVALVVPNVKVRVEVKHSVTPLSLHNFL